MIPYIDFRANNHFDRMVNPFEDTSAILRVLLDAKTVSKSDIDFIFSMSDGLNVEAITTSSKSNKHHYISKSEENNDILHFVLTNKKKETDNPIAVIGLSRIQKTSAALADKYGSEREIFDSIVLSEMAQSIRANLVVTNNAILLQNKDKGILNKVNPANPSDAIALIGLLRRSRNIFDTVLASDGSVILRNGHAKWTFFWAASREYITKGWELVSSTNQIESEKAKDLSLALHSRLSNILKCRDEIQKSLLVKQSNDSVENAIFYFEYYLLNVTAAFDVLARIIDEIYKPLDGKSKRYKAISWRSTWRDSLKTVAPKIANITERGRRERDVIEFAATLRNYIHAEGLLGSQHSVNGKTAPILIQIPVKEVTGLKPIIVRLWEDKFDERYMTEDSIMLDVGIVVEGLTPLVVSALNKIIALIEYASVENFDVKKVTGEPEDWFAIKDKSQILRQIGLDLKS